LFGHFRQPLNIGQIDPESDDETSFHLKSSRLFAIRAIFGRYGHFWGEI
jgi:hypothetical protein